MSRDAGCSTPFFSPKERLVFAALAGAAAAFIAFTFYRSIALSLISLAAGPALLPLYARYKLEKRRALMREQFRDLLYSLSASFAAGRQMPEALAEGLENLSLIYDLDTPMIEELTQMKLGIYENRMRDDELLKGLAERSGIEDIRNFAEVYAICRSTGGDVESVIVRASDMLTEKMEIEKAISVLASQKRFEGMIIAAMPVVMIGALNISSPDYLSLMYTTLAGRLIMSGCLALICAAFVLMTRLTRIKV